MKEEARKLLDEVNRTIPTETEGKIVSELLKEMQGDEKFYICMAMFYAGKAAALKEKSSKRSRN